ncbi:RNA polymerase sigma factor [Dyadobacter sp. NIV53]|uniref:RNA polymerase sigma factor n=1 Tax=Dyadobacter sp. NIV53 TaxID=2861765 RepID=UPI001C87E206|nr:sigma-70 family RNA polymerase sigma factor [Dyadobacter sp. NIV53]
MSIQLTDLSDEQLWRSLQEDDSEAFTILIKRYSRFLLSYGRKFSSDQELIKDSVQDLFTELWLYRKGLSKITSIHSYLLVSLRRKIFHSFKSFPHTSLGDPEEDEYSFMITFSIQDQWVESETEQHRLDQLNFMMNMLPARQKEVLYLKFYQNLSNQEIAELLKVQYQSVSNLLQRALTFLRTHWKEEFTLSMIISMLF